MVCCMEKTKICQISRNRPLNWHEKKTHGNHTIKKEIRVLANIAQSIRYAQFHLFANTRILPH